MRVVGFFATPLAYLGTARGRDLAIQKPPNKSGEYSVVIPYLLDGAFTGSPDCGCRLPPGSSMQNADAARPCEDGGGISSY
ncbi:hypothetical protein F4778DRAFT_262386 [Xylariomycetidae sp. FL2044]|nr:hypothetical protein F4778DRAFT_262386 [Xylariomycetidae sp. FL2044]